MKVGETEGTRSPPPPTAIQDSGSKVSPINAMPAPEPVSAMPAESEPLEMALKVGTQKSRDPKVNLDLSLHFVTSWQLLVVVFSDLFIVG